MISDEILEKVIERLTTRTDDLNEYILKTIGGKLDEIGSLKPTQAYQLVQTLKYGETYDQIVKKLSDITKLNVKDIEQIFKEVAKNDYKFAKQFYDYRNVPYIQFEQNQPLQQQLEAITRVVQRNYAQMMNPNVLGYGLVDPKTDKITFKGLRDMYFSLLDEAILSVSQGKETFDQVVQRQIKQMGGGGLKVIYDTTYVGKDGITRHYNRRLDSVIRMNMKDGLRQLHNETQQIFGEQFDSDGVEISVHLNPAPDHEDVQGKQFSNEEFEKFQTDQVAVSYDGVVFDPTYDKHDRRSISEYNCYHYVFSIVLGINTPEYTNQQLEQIKNTNNKGFEFDGKKYTVYEGTQLQRRIETEIRNQKDIQIMARSANQPEVVSEAQQKITQLTKKYKQLCDVSGLPTKADRLRVSRYHRAKVKLNK